MIEFERIVHMVPAYDGRPQHKGGKAEWRTEGMDKNTDYGVHGAEVRFVLKGPKGAVQFVVYTDWYPPHVQEELNKRGEHLQSVRPMGADVGYHSPREMYEGQGPTSESCEYLDGKPCYYDGSGLRAEEWVRNVLLKKGSDGVWEALEEFYEEVFE